MRKVMILVLAAGLGAAPAVAQNTTAPEPPVDANATNMVVPTDNNVMAANDITAVPEAVPVTDTAVPPATEAAPRSTGGFPWGIIGLVGLVGLMGRKRRD